MNMRSRAEERGKDWGRPLINKLVDNKRGNYIATTNTSPFNITKKAYVENKTTNWYTENNN